MPYDGGLETYDFEFCALWVWAQSRTVRLRARAVWLWVRDCMAVDSVRLHAVSAPYGCGFAAVCCCIAAGSCQKAVGSCQMAAYQRSVWVRALWLRGECRMAAGLLSHGCRLSVLLYCCGFVPYCCGFGAVWQRPGCRVAASELGQVRGKAGGRVC